MAKKQSKKPAPSKKSVAKKQIKNSAAKTTPKVAPKVNKVGIQPLGERVVVRPVVIEEVSASGFIIPDSAKKEKPERGEVVAVGAGKMLNDGSFAPLAVSVGDTVVFSRYGFEEVTIGDTEYYIISEANILAVVR